MWYRTSSIAFLILVAAAACGRKTSVARPDVPAVPAVPSPAADAASRGAADAVVACNTRWTLLPPPPFGLLSGALSGGIAGLLLVHDGAFQLLLVAGPDAETKAVALDGWPAPDAPGGVPVGTVVSYGDRFLVAYGMREPGRLVLRLRAVMPNSHVLPVNAPGRPGADGSPALELPFKGAPQPATILLEPFVNGVLLAASLPGASAGGGAAAPEAAWVVRTATGAPADPGALGFLLQPGPAQGSGPVWRIAAPDGTATTQRFVCALGTAAVVVDETGGAVTRVPAARVRGPFAFADGWVPAAGEPLWLAPDHVARRIPAAASAAPPPVELAVYDNTGALVARVALPAGASPLAIGRDARKFLALDDSGAVQLCGTDVPPSPPRAVDAVPSLAHPIEGIGVCGH